MAWTTKQLAEAAKVTDRYIRQLCKDGKLKADLYGHTWVIQDADAAQYLETRQQKQAQ